MFSRIFTSDFSKYGCNGCEEEETYSAPRILHIFIHARRTCYGDSSIATARRVGKVCNFELFMRVWGTQREAYGVKNGCTNL